MNFFNPLKWNLICWALLLLWLFFSIASNLPFDPDPEIIQSELTEMEERGFTSYELNWGVGWPMIYLESKIVPPKPLIRTYFPVRAVVNLLIVILTLLTIVYTIQNWLPQFSIRTALVGMTVLALTIVVGQAVYATTNYYLTRGFLFAIYFAPIYCALTLLAFGFVRKLTITCRSKSIKMSE